MTILVSSPTSLPLEKKMKSIWLSSLAKEKAKDFLFSLFWELTMIIALTRWIGHDNLHAAVRGIIRSPSFFPIAVANAVSISFVKLKKKKVYILISCSRFLTLHIEMLDYEVNPPNLLKLGKIKTRFVCC